MVGKAISATALLLAVASAQQTLWGQCGGNGYSGPTACGNGATCTKYNDWYFQCIPGPTTIASSSTRPTSSSVRPTSSSVKISTPGPITTSKSTSTSTSSRTTTSGPVVACTCVAGYKCTTISARATCVATATSSSASASPTSGNPNSGVKYLITFGDSYSQTGFDINGNKPTPQQPLGNPPLPGWTTSGGLNWIGRLVSTLNTSTVLSFNFASGGATVDASLVQPYAPTVLSVVDQTTQFWNTIGGTKARPSYAPWTGENSLFGIWIGVNDVGNSWWKYTPELSNAIFTQLFNQTQYMAISGAKNFVFLGVPPIQRAPANLANDQASRDLEASVIAQWNADLTARVASFAANFNVKATYVDTSAAFNTPLDNPTAYGAPNNSCYESTGLSCLWFNDYHPGQVIQRMVGEAVKAVVKGTIGW